MLRPFSFVRQWAELYGNIITTFYRFVFFSLKKAVFHILRIMFEMSIWGFRQSSPLGSEKGKTEAREV